MTYDRGDYDLAVRHVLEADARIARQRQLLARMRHAGHPTALGEDLLNSLQEVAREMRRHRDAIAVALGRER